MTAFVASNGLDNYFDAYTGGSVNATLDSYAISNNSRLVVRTDSYSCPNHTVAFGSLDTVTFGGIGGTLHFDPTYVRVIAYTGGSGNSPAYGTTISQVGVSGVFLGAWTSWTTEPIAAGAAIGATGYIKIGGKLGGNFSAGALTGITATCSGADVQGWIEVRGPDTATITVPRIGKVTSTEAWFELGTTNGTRGQIIPCPTTATNAGVFAGCQIETAAGSGIYEWFNSVGSQVALATTRTDTTCKFIWSTVTGLRIGNDGTNGVGFLPPTGCKVRIPAIIWTNCTRTAGAGSGPRVLPNATIATRQEFVTSGAGYLDLRGIVSQWYLNFGQAFYVKIKSCAINNTLVLSEIASPLDIDDCLVAPTQAQTTGSLSIASCFAGGTIHNSRFWCFSLASAGFINVNCSVVTGVTFSNNVFGSCTLRANYPVIFQGVKLADCTFTNNTIIGARLMLQFGKNITISDSTYYDHTITTTTASANPQSAIDITYGCTNITVTGITIPNPNYAPYAGLVAVSWSDDVRITNIGTYASPIVLNAAVTGYAIADGNNNYNGNSNRVTVKRCYVINTRLGFCTLSNSTSNLLIENCAGDYADTNVTTSLDTLIKNVAFTSATGGQVSVYGTHWQTRFTSTTAGFVDILCNEPTTLSAAQCYVTGGTPLFNSNGSVLLTKIGDQVTWEMPFFAIGYTAFTNSAPTITGTNVTYSANARWGNHDLHFQVDTGSGYGGTWLNLTAAVLTTNTFNSTTGFKLKIRATCAVAASTNVITNMRVALTTTNTDQGTKLYALSTNTLTFEGLTVGSEVRVYSGTNPDTSVEIGSVESSGTSFILTHELAGQQGYYQIIAESKVPIFQTITFPSTNASLTISQRPDRTFLNQ